MADSLRAWHEAHVDDYAAVLGRLNRVRARTLRGPIEAAATVLERAYVNAVLSIRTEKDRHERAFTAHYAGEVSIEDAALMTVYGGNKKWWLTDTFEAVDFRTLARAVRAHVRAGREAEALETVVGACKGVSYRKAAFMLAMSGLYEFACVDSNVANYADMDADREFASAGAYMDACDALFADLPVDGPRFLAQWAVYDFERGEHARHMPYFREVLG